MILSRQQRFLNPEVGGEAPPAEPSAYDELVLSHEPVLYLRNATTAPEDEAGLHTVTAHGSPVLSGTLPNGDPVLTFNGDDQYVEIADAADLSVSSGNAITVEAWIRPDVLQFSKSEGSGYVAWIAKGENGEYEWEGRMYDLENSEERPNRISGYAFNPEGALGIGSFFQDAVEAGEWIHFALVINAKASVGYAMGYTKVFKSGEQRDQDSLAELSIEPTPGADPMRLATRSLSSMFEGAIAKVALYDREVTNLELREHFLEMNPETPVGSGKHVSTVASAQNASSGTSLVATVGKAVPIGHTLMVRSCMAYNASSPTVTDSKGNTYTRDRSSSSEALGIRAACFSCPVTTALEPGDTITFTSPNVGSRVIEVDEFEGILIPTAVDAQNSASGTAAKASGAGVENATANATFISTIAIAGGTEVEFVQDGGWYGLKRGGPASTTLSLGGAWKTVITKASQPYQPVWASSQKYLQLNVAYKGA